MTTCFYPEFVGYANLQPAEIAQIGQNTGFFGHKYFLAKVDGQWGTMKLNGFHRFLRDYLGFFSETRSFDVIANIKASLIEDRTGANIPFNHNEQIIDRIKKMLERLNQKDDFDDMPPLVPRPTPAEPEETQPISSSKKHASNLKSIAEISAGQIGPVKFICDGVYAAEAMAPSGEKIYFGMESLENNDKEKWVEYKDTAEILVTGGWRDDNIGGLIQIGSRINDESALKEFLALRKIPDFWTSNQAIFEQLSMKLRERNIVENSPKAAELSSIPHASSGMNVNSQTHVVYASKTPIIGRINFDSDLKNFEGYVASYGDIIMSVGVTISDFVENRGIFRNPLSVVEGGYAGIAMMIHSFTCMTIEDEWPEVKTFRVQPLKKMGEIFVNSLPKDKVTVNGIRGDLYNKGFECEQDVRVPVEVLADLHRAK